MKQIYHVLNLRKVGLRLAISVNRKLEECRGPASTNFRLWSKFFN